MCAIDVTDIGTVHGIRLKEVDETPIKWPILLVYHQFSTPGTRPAAEYIPERFLAPETSSQHPSESRQTSPSL